MKRTIFISLIFFGMIGFNVHAQDLKLLDVPDGKHRPVLNDRAVGEKLIRMKHGLSWDLISSLTPEQKEKIDQIMVTGKKRLIQINNQIAEKEARLRTLQTADKPDMKSIYNVIDEIAVLSADKMKINADRTQQVRELLTEEQRVEYDLGQ